MAERRAGRPQPAGAPGSPGKAPDRRRETGRIGEDAAAAYLTDRGYAVKARNWRCKAGELDLVAERDGLLVIAEVRTRRAGGRFGTAAESVDARKQQRVRTVAGIYLRYIGQEDARVRFDVIAVTLRAGEAAAQLTHYEGAF